MDIQQPNSALDVCAKLFQQARVVRILLDYVGDMDHWKEEFTNCALAGEYEEARKIWTFFNMPRHFNTCHTLSMMYGNALMQGHVGFARWLFSQKCSVFLSMQNSETFKWHFSNLPMLLVCHNQYEALKWFLCTPMWEVARRWFSDMDLEQCLDAAVQSDRWKCVFVVLQNWRGAMSGTFYRACASPWEPWSRAFMAQLFFKNSPFRLIYKEHCRQTQGSKSPSFAWMLR